MLSNTKGAKGEAVAKGFLINKDFEVIKTNYHSRYGEIDIIAKFNEYIIFVEVKTRKANAMVSPAESVTRSKRNKIIKTAVKFMIDYETKLQPRFDIVEVISTNKKIRPFEVNYIENAFWLEDDYVFI